MSEDWYIENEDGSVVGPLQERLISAQLLTGQITDSQRVRQGQNADWCPADRARAVFQRLAELGWYIKDSLGREFGPFTDAKVLELHRSEEIGDGSQIRQGLQGAWRAAEPLLAQWHQQPVTTVDSSEESEAAGKWSVAPIRHIVLHLPIEPANDYLPMERLLLDDSASQQTLAVTRTNGQHVGVVPEQDVAALRFQFDRGVKHLAFLVSATPPDRAQISVVSCPPGSTSEMCRAYVEQHFSPTAAKTLKERG